MNALESFISRRLLSRFSQRADLHRMINNAGWLVGDKLLRLGGGVFISIKITNYLGAAQYGLMNAAMAFATLLLPLTNLGLDSILVRELVSRPEQKNLLLGSAWLLKFMGSLLALVLGLTAAWFWFEHDAVATAIAGLQLLTFLVLSLDVLDLYYQSKVKSKYPVYARNIAFVIFAGIKIWLLVHKAGLMAFVIAQTAEYVAALLIQLLIFNRQGASIFQWKFSKGLMRRLLSDSWMQALSTLVILIYMRTDQVMLKKIVGDAETGIFSAAVRLSEVWYFVPNAIVASVAPALVAAYAGGNRALFLAKLQRLFTTMIWLGIAVALFTQLLAQPVINLLYKPEFAEAGQILVLHIWTGVFVSFGVASVQYFIIINETRYNFYRTLAGALANVGLNLLLIPKMGAVGAAIGTLVSQAVSTTFSTLFFKDSRLLFFMFVKALNPQNLIERGRKK